MKLCRGLLRLCTYGGGGIPYRNEAVTTRYCKRAAIGTEGHSMDAPVVAPVPHNIMYVNM